ncbi:MAG: Fe-S cluster assembly protein SufD [Acidobacteria bacterium]|nr:MAG: Fe-S cluster assembly protein SufD [Acidobacteriota bacterium]
MAIDSIANLSAAATRAWEPPELSQARSEAALKGAELALPSDEEEDWRYTDVSRIDLGELQIPEPTEDPEPVEMDQFSAGRISGVCPVALEALGEMSGAISVVDGMTVGQAIAADAAGLGVEFGASSRFATEFASWNEPVADDKFSALAVAVGAGAFLRMPQGKALREPFAIWQNSHTPGVLGASHTRIRLEQASSARVLMHQAGSPDGRSLLIPKTEVSLGPGATLDLVIVQELSNSLDQIGSVDVRLERDAQIKIMTVTVGGGLSRLRAQCHLNGEGAGSVMLGASLGRGSSHIDHRTLQEHAASNTSSDLLYKTVVDDEASSVYSGLIRVEKNVRKVAGYQVNRNLILSEGASAESVPNLEILANDVKCSHASATGPVDEEQLYYLQSRGISRDVAERLIVVGFLGQVLGRSPIPELVPVLRELISDRLAGDDNAGGENG